VPARVRSATATTLLRAQLAATLPLAGLCWAEQLAVYPSLTGLDPASFPAWHAVYTSGISLVVGPLMAVEALCAAALLWLPPARVPRAALRLGLGLVGVVLASTALIQAPLLGRLASAPGPELIRWLVASNWLRTTTWSLRGALAIWMATRPAAPPAGPGPAAPAETPAA